LDPTFIDHCHGTLIVHHDRSVECTDPGCELPDMLRHAFIVDCIALGGCCTTEALPVMTCVCVRAGTGIRSSWEPRWR
jgi:hypothetical protein